MLYRKIENTVKEKLSHSNEKILIVEGARQIGKSFIVRKVGSELFKNFVEINLAEDKATTGLFANVKSVDDFILRVSSLGKTLGTADDTLIFLDEIQEYPEMLTMLKFLLADGRYRYVASGSLLGVTLRRSTSIPIGSIELLKMYPLDFEEFIIANGVDGSIMRHLQASLDTRQSIEPGIHHRLLDLFRKYLLVGGLPQAVNAYIETHNINAVRNVQTDITNLYEIDASKYSEEHCLKIRHLYRLIPSALESRKKRIVFKDIENIKGKRFKDYQDEFDYLIDSGIALEVAAISGPSYPLIASAKKNLLKLYMNDVGLLTNLMYGPDIRPVLDRDFGTNLGNVYENAVAQELTAHGFATYYYDNKNHGEVDFLIDDKISASVIALEVKSGKDYKVHSALNTFVSNADYDVDHAFVLSNSGIIEQSGKIVYMPVYYASLFNAKAMRPDMPVYF